MLLLRAGGDVDFLCNLIDSSVSAVSASRDDKSEQTKDDESRSPYRYRHLCSSWGAR